MTARFSYTNGAKWLTTRDIATGDHDDFIVAHWPLITPLFEDTDGVDGREAIRSLPGTPSLRAQLLAYMEVTDKDLVVG